MSGLYASLNKQSKDNKLKLGCGFRTHKEDAKTSRNL